MSKVKLTLTVDGGIIDLAKASRINISQLVEDTLRAELMTPDDFEEIQLKIKNFENDLRRIDTEASSKKGIINIQLSGLTAKLQRLKNEQRPFNASAFDDLKSKFKIICIQKEFIIPSLTIKTWRGIFAQQAGKRMSDDEVIALINSFKSEHESEKSLIKEAVTK